MIDDKKPRTVEAALETKEFVAWKNSGKATRESCPLNIVADEKVLMIEHSAYDAIKKENEELKANYNGLDLEFDQFRARCPIPNMDVINDNIKLRQEITSLRESLKLAVEALELAEHRLHESINGQFRKFYDEADKDMRLAKSIIDHSLAKIKAKGGL